MHNSVRELSVPEGINLGRLLAYTIPRLGIIVAAALICAIVAGLWALTIKPEYRGQTKIEVMPEEESVSLAEQMFPVLSGTGLLGESGGQSTVARLSSLKLARQTIDKLGLQVEVIDPRDTFFSRSFGRIATKLGRAGTAPDKDAPVRLSNVDYPERCGGHSLTLRTTGDQGFELIDVEGLFGKSNEVLASGTAGEVIELAELKMTVVHVDPEAGRSYTLNLRREAEWLKDFRDRLAADSDRLASGIIAVSYHHYYPQLVKDVLEALVDEFVAWNLAERGQSEQQRLKFIKDELALRETALVQAQEDYYSFRERKQAVEISSQGRILLEQIADYDTQLNEAKLTRKAVDDLLSALAEGDEAKFHASPYLASRNDLLLADLVSSLATLEVEREALLVEYTERHPAVTAYDEQIAETETAIHAHLTNSLDQLDDNIAEYERYRTSYLSKAEQLPATERELFDKQRDFESALALVDFLRQQQAEVELTLASLAPNIRFIDEAEVGTQPYKPRLGASAVAGLLLGLVLGLVGLFFMFLSHAQVLDETDAAEAGPVLAVLSHRSWQEQLPLTASTLAGLGSGSGLLLHDTPGIKLAPLAHAITKAARELGIKTLALIDTGPTLTSAIAEAKPTQADLSLSDLVGTAQALRTEEGQQWIKSAIASHELVVAAPPPISYSTLGHILAKAAGKATIVAVRGITARKSLVELCRQLALAGVEPTGILLVHRAVLTQAMTSTVRVQPKQEQETTSSSPKA